MARRRTTRRKGRRTGGIELPEPLVARMMRAVRGAFESVAPSGEDELLAAIFGEQVSSGPTVRIVPRPVSQYKRDSVRMLPPEVQKRMLRDSVAVTVGTYKVPSIKPRAPHAKVSLTLVDPNAPGYSPSQSGSRVVGTGYLGSDFEVVQLSATKRRAVEREAFRALGMTRRDAKSIDPDELAGACMWTSVQGYQIVMRVKFNQPYKPDALFRTLESVLRHELAHAMDEGLRAQDRDNQQLQDLQLCTENIAELMGVEFSSPPIDGFQIRGQEDEAWTPEQWGAYYNLPHEVAARLTEAVDQLADEFTLLELRLRLSDEEGPTGRVLLEWARQHSTSVREMWPRLDDTNQRRVARAIYDMAAFEIEDAGRSRPRVLPNRRRRRR